jgi:hypothetical protein
MFHSTFGSLITCSLLMLSSLLMHDVAWAQRDAGAKARGDFTFYARSGGSHMNAAHAHASHYHSYLGRTQAVSSRVMRMSGSTINHHLELSQQHLDALHEHFEATEDAASLAAVDEIEKQLAQAKHHHAIAESRARTSPEDIAAIQESVEQLRVSLDQAIHAYADLLSRHDVDIQRVPVPEQAKSR